MEDLQQLGRVPATSNSSLLKLSNHHGIIQMLLGITSCQRMSFLRANCQHGISNRHHRLALTIVVFALIRQAGKEALHLATGATMSHMPLLFYDSINKVALEKMSILPRNREASIWGEAPIVHAQRPQGNLLEAQAAQLTGDASEAHLSHLLRCPWPWPCFSGTAPEKPLS